MMLVNADGGHWFRWPRCRRRLVHKPLVQGGVPVIRQIAKQPIPALVKPSIRAVQVEDKGDAPAAAVQLADIVRSDWVKAKHPRVEVIRRVRIILEDVGYQMRVATHHGFFGGRAHQSRRDCKLAAILRLYGEAADFGNPAAVQELLDIKRVGSMSVRP